MNQIIPTFQRELLGYFRSPVAYVFLAVFHLSTVGLAFFMGGFFKNNDANLEQLFAFYPWLFLFFIPAVGMRLWSDEQRTGSSELLFTLPITVFEAVVAKFLAGWAFICIGIALSLSMTITAAYLGDPDWGIIFTGYLGSVLMAASFLSICAVCSSLTNNQVISFVISVVVCFGLVMLGTDFLADILYRTFSVEAVDFIRSMSFVPHYMSMTRGLVEFGSLSFFILLSVAGLALNVIVLKR